MTTGGERVVNEFSEMLVILGLRKSPSRKKKTFRYLDQYKSGRSMLEGELGYLYRRRCEHDGLYRSKRFDFKRERHRRLKYLNRAFW